MAVKEYEYENGVDESEDLLRVSQFHWRAHQFNRIGFKSAVHAVQCFARMIKYAFVMAARLALCLSHDVESNPGPRFDSRTCLELVVRNLSEVLRSQLPVSGSLWSETVACAARAAGYSTQFTWNNPSGKNKGSIPQLIKRAFELGRLLKSMGCLPNELDPFVFRLDEEEIQRQLAIHFRIKNFKSAVDALLEYEFNSKQSEAIIQIVNAIKLKNVGSQHNNHILGYLDCDVTKTAHINIADPETTKSGIGVHSDVSGSIDTTTPMLIGQPLENACRRLSRVAVNPGYISDSYVGVAKTSVGPDTFSIRNCIQIMIQCLSEKLRYHLPVSGTLWSESVAEAAYATGYSTDCQWSNPSGNKKDKLSKLIQRATELGRVLTTLDCLPAEFAPFVNDLGNNAVQEQLMIHYKVKNFKSAVDIILKISSLGDEKQAIMHEIQRLKQIFEVPHSSDRQMDSGRLCNCTDFERLADSRTLHPTVSYHKKTVRRKRKIDRPRKENGNNLEILNTSAVLQPEDEITFCQQMDPCSEGNNENRIVQNLDETTSTVSKMQELTVNGDLATKFLSSTRTLPDGTSASDEHQTLSISTKGFQSFGSTAYASDSNMTKKQPDNKLIDDILILLDQNSMDDDARNADMRRTATTSSGRTQLQVSELATISPSGSISTGQEQEVKQQKTVYNLNDQLTRNLETPTYVLGTNPPVLSEVVTFPPEGDQACQKHVDHTTEQEGTEWIIYAYPPTYDDQIMGLQNLFPGQIVLLPAEGSTNSGGVEESSINITEIDKGSDSTLQENTREDGTIMELQNLIPGENASCKENNSRLKEGNANSSGVEERSMNINQDITESDDSDSTLQENTGKGSAINFLERDRDSLTQDRAEAEAEKQRTEDDESIKQFLFVTEVLSRTKSPLAIGSNSCHEAARDEVTSVDGGHRAEDDTCENEAETLFSGAEQFADAEAETEPIQQNVFPMTAVTSSYPDTDRDYMYREETVDDNTSGTQKNEAEYLTLGSELFASTEPADTGKQRMGPTVEECFAKFKASLFEEVDARLEAFKAALGKNTPNEHVGQNENGEPLDCASSAAEHTEPRIRSSDLRKRYLTDPENGPTSKTLRQ